MWRVASSQHGKDGFATVRAYPFAVLFEAQVACDALDEIGEVYRDEAERQARRDAAERGRR